MEAIGLKLLARGTSKQQGRQPTATFTHHIKAEVGNFNKNVF